MKTSELIGPTLDWAVAKCEGAVLSQSSFTFQIQEYGCLQRPHLGNWKPSTDWAQGGPIIEREEIGFAKYGPQSTWKAVIGETPRGKPQYGPTPLIAAMRCYVASKLGDVVEIPEELT